MKDEQRFVTMIKCSFVTWNNNDMVLTVTCHGSCVTVTMSHVTQVRPLCNGQHPTAGRGGVEYRGLGPGPQPGRSGDTVADTLVDTVDRGHEKPCDHVPVLIENFVATILFNSLDAFCLFT